jgi:hypothetical protein
MRKVADATLFLHLVNHRRDYAPDRNALRNLCFEADHELVMVPPDNLAGFAGVDATVDNDDISGKHAGCAPFITIQLHQEGAGRVFDEQVRQIQLLGKRPLCGIRKPPMLRHPSTG